MTDNIQESEMLYNADEVAVMLGIKDSTLRKYAGLLNKHGYKFHTNDKGHRGYMNKDVAVLKRLKETKEGSDMTLERSAEAVVTWALQSDMTDSDTTEKKEIERYSTRFEEMEKKIDQQNELIKKLIETLDERDKKRDQALMQHIREVQETKQLLLAAKEEEEVKEEPKKGFWSRLFGQ